MNLAFCHAWATEHEGNWPIHRAGLMIRTAHLRAIGGWVASPADDVAMFAALSEVASGHNEPTVTWLYRHHEQQTHRTAAGGNWSYGRRIAPQRAAAVRATATGLGFDPARLTEQGRILTGAVEIGPLRPKRLHPAMGEVSAQSE
ncbi:MAG TPA: hypothetical protein VHW44_06825 [Pseudonocardiaceae bacterium]|nr:hypothetical protein [Pseudonocardiaceae bacterium]